MALYEAKTDITLEEIRSALADKGIRAGIGTLWRFFERHGITRKKRRRMRRSKTVQS